MTTMLGRRAALGAAAAMLAAPAARADSTLDVLMAPSALRPEIVEMFKQRTGITLRPAPYVSPADTLTRLLSGTAPFGGMATLSDLVRPNLAPAVSRRLLQPVDEATVPNLGHLAPAFGPDRLALNGKIYAIPIYWGYNFVLYNRKKVNDEEPALASWNALFDDKFAGRVAIRDDPQEMIQITALAMGNPDPLNMERADIDEVKKFLISKKRNFRTLWGSFAEGMQLMSGGEVDLMYGWLLMRKTLQKQGFDVASSRPQEGLLSWVHAGFIPARSPDPADALRWFDFLLSPEIVSILTDSAGVLSCSQLAVDRLTPEQQRLQGYDVLSSGAKTVRSGLPKHLGLWNEAWSQFKAA